MQHTTNLNLNKPETTDYVDIDDLNENMDTLDTEVEKKVEKVNNITPDSNHNVTLDPDDLDDASTAHKFVSASQIQDIADNKTARHSHSNKSLLDSYTQANSDIADAVTKKHTHSNKGTLDGIASSDVAAWNAKASKPDLGTISLTDTWTGSASPYTQTVTVTGATVTSNSKVDIQPNSTVIAQLITDEVNAIYIENNNGTLTCYAIGNKPTVALSNVQVLVTEVVS